MSRALTFELPLLWALRVETAPGAGSGWPHPGEPSLAVIARVGGGVATVNVDHPA